METPTSPTLDIVIVNWNTGSELARCISSVRDTDWAKVDLRHVVVVDNASTDTSIAFAVAQGHSLPLRILRNETNLGFARACNQGAWESGADYLLFLNPDAVLQRDAIGEIVAFLEGPAHKDAGIAGALMVDANGHLALSAARLPSLRIWLADILRLHWAVPRLFPRFFLDPRTLLPGPTMVGTVIGACYCIRRELFRRLGGFDERFFLYYEEADLSLRAAQAGFTAWTVPHARVIHPGGASARQVRAFSLFHSLRSRRLYARKHFGALTAIWVTLLTWFPELPLRLLLALGGGSRASFLETLRAYRMLLAGRGDAR